MINSCKSTLLPHVFYETYDVHELFKQDRGLIKGAEIIEEYLGLINKRGELNFNCKHFSFSALFDLAANMKIMLSVK
jgi:hypothetical protein